MIFCDSSRKLTVVVGVLMLTSSPAFNSAFAQPNIGAAAERQLQLVEAIEIEETQNGPLAEGLIDPLTALAHLYEEEGYLVLAVSTIDRALQVIRANHGLHSLEQVPLMQQLINLQETSGSAVTAWDLEKELLTLARRHPGDLRAVPVFRDTAEKRMELLDRYIDGENLPQIILGCYYDWPGIKPGESGPGPDMSNCTSGNRTDVETALIADAQRHFAEAVAVVLRNERGQSDVLRELELELAKSAFRSPGDARLGRTDARLEPWSSWADALIRIANWDPADPNRHAELNQEAIRDKSIPTQYGIGRSALNRLYAQEVATGSWQSQADALVQIADWDLVHSRNSIALSEYELLYVKLQDMGVAQGAIDEIFSPTVPVVLPRLIPDPLTSTAPQGSGGFVDVAFEITRFGESRDVEVLDSSPEVTPSSVRNIVNTIQGSNFRPRTTNGRFSRSSSVTVRYFLNDPN